ncbi:aminomethyl-transferring glycine dehydrogenase subunit GcvPA [Leadbettera azotonutricia]|uniref:Probable glycine dehydrogenase (decarboxylating) subunit 1 n=1 Tax=Leadbettera azotonutricia (strain ATCC BAA-888 / DSM 13862 / ZAS-9) TaxID=545695 RepID=F5YBS2_LEAAZ|nr:aminomethyl-transferring glycine dehydrogenase subunit GcvPA [Leadbettera azotonutricia]AEF83059.1 glycine dehydrogenase (decarboxylating) [Leadbettera azotonutricia ZAS-9]
MGSYIPNTETDRSEMLAAMGRKSIDELFANIPENVRIKDLNIPKGMAELDVTRAIASLAGENKIFSVVFRGAGAYKHYIPAAVKRITANETFTTAYTPYQAEISQGILQSIFEYQTMICELTGMDAANASVYDGASAAAEAMNMCRDRGKNNIYVSGTAHPQVIETIRTYCFGYGIPVIMIPKNTDGKTDLTALKNLLADDKAAAGIYIQSPNFFGLVEDIPGASEIAHANGALLATGVNPISLGLLESPGALGADIALGEGQPLGMPLAWGGPYLGFIACKNSLMRKLPGRIVGETTDTKGERAFVLTLQAREQHIRREKASSNICSNEAHCALTAAVYLSVMGEEGFAEAARQCHSKAIYTAKQISAISGYSLVYDGEFFNEFVTQCPDTEKALKVLEKDGILGGYPLGKSQLLWCVTELNTKDEIDRMACILKEATL